jgi:hypothetical protein
MTPAALLSQWRHRRIRETLDRVNDEPIAELRRLLERRLAVIADHGWRDRDPEGHLEALKEVSLAIGAWTARHRTELDGRLRHFLDNASFDKALDRVRGAG